MKIRQMMRVWTATILAVVTLAVAGAPLAANAQAVGWSKDIWEAQMIMTHFGIPTGPIDGLYGPKTAQGLCTLRYLGGLPVNRANLDSATLNKLRHYNQSVKSLSDLSTKGYDGHNTFLFADLTCQTMVYVENGHFSKVIPISTGKDGFATPTGKYWLGFTHKGWTCSTSYPEGCANQSAGRFSSTNGAYGNMYNQRPVSGMGNGGYFVHGSTSVPTYPASHGCIRVPINYSDWMYDHVGNNGPTYFVVYGH
jgi:hypothetical protein